MTRVAARLAAVTGLGEAIVGAAFLGAAFLGAATSLADAVATVTPALRGVPERRQRARRGSRSDGVPGSSCDPSTGASNPDRRGEASEQRRWLH
jgi:hypothetical protein